jgi:hypothetical protein
MLFVVVERLTFRLEGSGLEDGSEDMMQPCWIDLLYLFIIPALCVALLFLELSDLVSEFIYNLDARGEVLFHTALVCIEFRNASFRSMKG